MKGVYPVEYFSNPHINKPIEEIYADIDAYSSEFFEDETDYHEGIDFVIPFPPLYYEGQFIKGMFFSQSAEFLLKLYPDLSKLFFSIANTMWTSYSWSQNADAYMTCYKNQHREDWFRRTNPDRGNKTFIPLQDADFTNEYTMYPLLGLEKDIDILCISRFQQLKNIPLIAKALKIYRQKYNHPIKMTYIVGKEFGVNFDGLDEHEKNQLRMIEEELIHPSDYIEFIPHVNYFELPKYYTRARVLVLGALIEGKNRTIYEAMSCDTPVIVFNDFNKYARGGAMVFPEGAGLYCPQFDAESLADTMHNIFTNQNSFSPRRKFLEVFGRKNFLNTCIESFPYYAENLPEYKQNRIYNNVWADMAICYNYQISLHDFLYSRNAAIQHVQGLTAIDKLIKFFYRRFGIR